jgi:hypothetical protein
MLFDRAFLEKTLVELDQRDHEMDRLLENFAATATTRPRVRQFRQLQRIYAQERAHNAKCKVMLEAWLAELPSSTSSTGTQIVLAPEGMGGNESTIESKRGAKGRQKDGNPTVQCGDRGTQRGKTGEKAQKSAHFEGRIDRN